MVGVLEAGDLWLGADEETVLFLCLHLCTTAAVAAAVLEESELFEEVLEGEKVVIM